MLDEILLRYDRRPDGFEIIALSQDVRALFRMHQESGTGVPFPVLGEQLAFDLHFHLDPEGSGWGTHYGPSMPAGNREYPALSAITADVVAYWADRARHAAHPLLQFRYADLAWDLWRKARTDKCPVDLPRIMIDAAVGVADRRLDPHQVDAIDQLHRALGVAISIKDKARVGRVRDAILAYEDAVGVDHLTGLWGFSFDLLLNNKKAELLPVHAEKIVEDMETRLERLFTQSDAQLDPHHVQSAALRLGGYYRRQQRPDDVQRVLGLYACAFLRKSASGSQLVASGWLKDVHETLLHFGLHDYARAILPHYSQAGRSASREMVRHSVSVEIELDERDQYVDSMTTGTWEEVFGKLYHSYLLRRDAQMQLLRKIRGTNCIVNLFGTTPVDRDGRAVAQIGPLDTDPEGNLIHHMARMMSGVTAMFLRATMERLIDARGLDWTVVEAQLRPCPVFADADWSTLERAVRAYLEQDWVVAVHLLVPQLEAAVRRLVRLQGGGHLKAGRNGGMQLRNLDELLRDEKAEQCLTEDVTFYLRTLLTDQRGWNLRNDVAHGIEPVPGFTAAAADRLFHALLIMGGLKSKEPPLPPEPSPVPVVEAD